MKGEYQTTLRVGETLNVGGAILRIIYPLHVAVKLAVLAPASTLITKGDTAAERCPEPPPQNYG